MKTLIILIFFLTILCEETFSQPVICNLSDFASNWHIIGPLNDYTYNNIGRVTAIWVDEDDNNYILAGTRGSGLWRSVDGGLNWSNLTSYQLPATGVYSIDVYKDGANKRIYCSTLFNGSDLNLHGLGLIYSDDNGLTWVRETTFPSGVAPFKTYGKLANIGPRRIKFRPGTSELYICNGSSLFQRNTAGVDSWAASTKVNLDVHGNNTITTHSINEIDFCPGNNNIAVISPLNGLSGDLLYSSNFNSASPIWIQLPLPNITLAAGESYSVGCSTSFLNDDYFFVISKFIINNAMGKYVKEEIYLTRYNIDAPLIPVYFEYPIFTLELGPDYSTFTEFTMLNAAFTGVEQLNFIVGATQNTVFRGSINHTPTNSVVTTEISEYYGSNTHGDIRDLTIVNNLYPNNPKLFIASDGGVSKCENLLSASTISGWTNLNGSGLTITEFVGFNSSEFEKENIMLSSPDGNNYVFNQKTGATTTTFRNSTGGDAYDAAISKINSSKAIQTSNSYGIRVPSYFGAYNIFADNSTGLSAPATPKSDNSPCTATQCDLGTCPDMEDCRETNFSLKPFSFELDYTGVNSTSEFFYTGTSDVFRVSDPFSGPSSADYTNLSQTHSSIDGLDPDLDVITKNPITAYKRISTPEFVYTFFATKETRNIGDALNEDLVKVVKTRNTLLTNEVLKTDITPTIDEDPTANVYNQLDNSWITDLVIDESVTNPDQAEIWVSFGANTLEGRIVDYVLSDDPNDPHKDTKKGRVYYSPDGGNNWQNKSAGLPNYPVLALVYWKGSNDIIFAGTDVGVYVWNKNHLPDGAWECFSTNMPYGSVNDLEIQYCTNTLKATIFGYGLWETPLPDLNYSSNHPQYIYGNVVWGSDKKIETDIWVTDGSVLTIENATIDMAANKSIKVQTGGRLVIDGATITNNCESFWYGIEVMGNKSLSHPSVAAVISGAYPSTSTDHGVVYLKNGATIKNSKKGVTASMRFLTTEIDDNYGGGIIIARDAFFINNIEAASFYKFTKDNVSEFYNCEFITDNFFNTGAFPKQHIYLRQTKGVLFRLCTFVNNTPYFGPDGVSGINRGKGIFSEESTFDVIMECVEYGQPCGCNQYEGNSFTTLFRAIEAYSIGQYFSYPLSINGNYFYGNDRAVLISGMGNLKISSNLFEIPDRGTSTCYGLYLEGCFSYGNAENHLEDNTFKRWSLSTENPLASCSGLFIANNSNTTEEVYRNYFETLDIGIRCQNNNSGLTLKCNTFTQPIYNYNIAVTSGNIHNQGTCGLSDLPAGNEFSGDCSLPYGDFYLQSGVPGIHYYHHNGLQPTCYSPGITLHNCYSIKNETSCPSKLSDPCEIEQSAMMMITQANDISTTIEIENLKIDGGSTVELINKINNTNVTPYEFDEIGPYLTDTVLNTLIESDIFNTNNTLSIVAENAPISNDLANTVSTNLEIQPQIIELLSDSIDLLPNGIPQVVTSPLRELNLYTETLIQSKQLLLYGAIDNYLISDKIDSAIIILSEDNTNWSKFKLAEIYLLQNDSDEASAKLNEINNPSTDELLLVDYLKLISQINSENKPMDSLSEEELVLLTDISSKETTAGINAFNLLRLNGIAAEPEVIDSIYELSELRMLLEDNLSETKNISISPNPTQSSCYITLNNSEINYSEYFVNISSVLGDNIYSKTLPVYNQNIFLSTDFLTPGVYLLEVKSNTSTLGIGKLVIY